MDALAMGQKMVEMIRRGREGEAAFVAECYAPDIVSIEGQGSEQMPARLEGIDAIRGKHDWWYANNEVHGVSVEGPFVGNRDDQFVLRFTLDATPSGGSRNQMSEVGIYTVRDGRIAQEEYLYLMA